MGEHDVKELDSESLRAFTRKLLGDLQALELMLKHGGGGHRAAGTCQGPNETADALKDALIAEIVALSKPR